MLFYNSIFISLVIIYYSVKNTRRLSRQLYIVCFVLLFLLSAFRFDVGCDWHNYLYNFENLDSTTFKEFFLTREPLWSFLIYGINQLDLPYPWLNVVSSVLFFAGIHVLARRQPDPFSFLLLLFPILILNMPMSAIRQGAAIGVLCIAFSAFIDKKLVLYIAWTLIASTLHISALVFLTLAPLVLGKHTKKRLALTALLAALGMVMMAGSDSAQYVQDTYIGTGFDAEGALFRIGTLIATSALFFLALRKGWVKTFPTDYKLVAIGSWGMLIVFLILPVGSVIADRLGYYLMPIQAMILARIAYLPVYKNKALYRNTIFLSFIAFLLVWSYFSLHFQICYTPYRTWIFGMPEG